MRGVNANSSQYDASRPDPTALRVCWWFKFQRFALKIKHNGFGRRLPALVRAAILAPRLFARQRYAIVIAKRGE